MQFRILHGVVSSVDQATEAIESGKVRIKLFMAARGYVHKLGRQRKNVDKEDKSGHIYAHFYIFPGERYSFRVSDEPCQYLAEN